MSEAIVIAVVSAMVSVVVACIATAIVWLKSREAAASSVRNEEALQAVRTLVNGQRDALMSRIDSLERQLASSRGETERLEADKRCGESGDAIVPAPDQGEGGR